MPLYPQLQPTPEAFELEVKRTLDALGAGLTDYRSEHRKVAGGSDGEYEIDVTISFTALGLNFITLVECKHYKRPVERERVLALHAKLQSLGAQKAVLYSTSGFQSGAIEYAGAHGIGLVHLQDGRANYFRRSVGSDEPIPWSEIPPGVPAVTGTLIQGQTRCLVTPERTQYLEEFLRG